ncbi:hypothetical protein GLYMA_14G092600v4 [Glycine max]|nr:hypothetical protein GLYMA_14G092600v4 [Glycine max]KAH1093791.1 hypothetical protein GYH30_039499 [Glycine max]
MNVCRMDKESHQGNSVRERDKVGGDSSSGGAGSLLLRGSSDGMRQAATTSDLGLQWGNRKRLRCMKVQVKHDPSSSNNPVQRTTTTTTTVRVDRRVVRNDKDSSSNLSISRSLPTTATLTNNNNNNHISLHNNNNINQSNGYLNLRQRPPSPQQPPPRILRNSETSSAMRGGQSNGSVRGIASPDRGAHDKRGTQNNHLNDNNNKSVVSSDTAHDSKKGGGGSPSGSGDAAPPVWPPKFVIALTNKEKEEDFLLLKGSKLPQRPKKRAKFIQRTLNLVSPGTWLCDLTLERYEVREKKISKKVGEKKRPRGLKAMGNMDSDSE